MDDMNRPIAGSLSQVSRCRVPRTALVLLLTAHASFLAWQGWRYSPTFDEVAHLPSGLSHWKFGRFDLYRVNPPLVRLVASLPMLLVDPKTDWSGFTEAPYARPEFTIGTNFVNSNGFDVFWYFTLCRWACIPFSLIGGWICFRWARDLYGAAAGIVALVLWCFCPNILGNGALITPDTGSAALGVAAAYCFWRWLRDPDWTRALVCGVTLGMAELTKSTWIILFAMWPLLWIVWRASRSRQSDATSDAKLVPNAAPVRQTGHTRLAARKAGCTQLAAILGIALYLLNLGYGFETSFKRLGQFEFISDALGGSDAHKTPGNRFTGTWMASLPMPVPANYLSGIDVQRRDFEVGKWSYLRGEQRMGGWWYYYLYAMGVKMPVGTLFLFGLACLVTVVRFTLGCTSRLNGFCDSRPARRDSILDSLTLLAPAIFVIFFVSSQTGFNRYVRYDVPAFPFLFIWTSQLAVLLSPRSTPGAAGHYLRFPRLGPRNILPAAIVLGLVASGTSSLAVFPHSLSYFNELAGGPLNGAAHLLDANIDWGQDLLYLKEWCDTHAEARPLHLAWFGFVDPKLAGIEFQAVPSLPADHPFPNKLHSQPDIGWYAISVNELYGYNHYGPREVDYRWLGQFQPAAHAGYSILIYHVTRPL